MKKPAQQNQKVIQLSFWVATKHLQTGDCVTCLQCLWQWKQYWNLKRKKKPKQNKIKPTKKPHKQPKQDQA